MNTKQLSAIVNKSVSSSIICGLSITLLGTVMLVVGFLGIASDQDYMNPYGVFGGFLTGLGVGSFAYYRSLRKIQFLVKEDSNQAEDRVVPED